MKKFFLIRRCTLLLLLLTLCSTTNNCIYTQSINQNFPKESMESRLNKIVKISKENILFDSNLKKNIDVPALKIINRNTEEVLTESLSTTTLTFKKQEEVPMLPYLDRQNPPIVRGLPEQSKVALLKLKHQTHYLELL